MTLKDSGNCCRILLLTCCVRTQKTDGLKEVFSFTAENIMKMTQTRLHNDPAHTTAAQNTERFDFLSRKRCATSYAGQRERALPHTRPFKHRYIYPWWYFRSFQKNIVGMCRPKLGHTCLIWHVVRNTSNSTRPNRGCRSQSIHERPRVFFKALPRTALFCDIFY